MSKKAGKPRKELPPEQMKELEGIFRAGIMTWRDMGKRFGVGMAWLKDTAEIYSWTRDLVQKIQHEAERKVQEAVARDESKKGPIHKLTEREVTEANVDVIVRVTGSHRALLSRSRNLAEKLFDELEFSTANLELLDKLVAELYAGDDRSRAELINRLVSMAGRSATFKQLVDSVKVIIATEREVLRIADSSQGQESSVGALISRVMGSSFKPVQENHGAD